MTWPLRAGDPTVAGWFITAGYFLTAASCLFRRYAVASSITRTRWGAERIGLWIGLGMLFLAFNKQLDWHASITVLGRNLARANGWMGYRRTVQFWFVMGVLGLLGITLTAIFWRLRRRIAEHFWLVMGLCILFGFVAVRAASFHHVDLWFGQAAFGIRRRHLVELSGIVCVLIWALRQRAIVKMSPAET